MRVHVARIVPVVVLVACSSPDAGPSDTSEDGDAPGPLAWSMPENISNSTTFSDLRMNWGNNLAASDGAVHATWREVEREEDGVDVARIVSRRLAAGEWGKRIQDISTVETGTGHPAIAASGPHVYITWHRYMPPEDDVIWFAASDADGADGTFSVPAAIVTDAAVLRSPMGEYATTPSISAWGDWVHIAWSDERMVDACGMQVPEVYVISSSDRVGWSAVSMATEPDCRTSWTPSIASWGGHVHVAWTDDRDEDGDCGLTGSACHEEEYYRRLSEDGTVPETVEVRLTNDEPGNHLESWAPNIAAWEGNVQVVWLDRSGGDDFEIYHVRSRDAGVSWDEPMRRLSFHGPGCLSARPTIAGTGTLVHVVWFEKCGDTASTVLHRWSEDLGETWSDVSDVTSGTGVFAIQPYVALGDGRVHVLWTDGGEIYHASSL